MRLAKNKNGVAAVEFALVLPLLIILVFGIIEFGLALYDKAVITNASREGARAGIVARYDSEGEYSPYTSSDIKDVVENYCADHLVTFGSALGPSTTTDAPCSGSGNGLTVTVTYHYDFLVLPNFIGGLIGGTDLGAETVMRCE